jgi:hypothetical protein
MVFNKGVNMKKAIAIILATLAFSANAQMYTNTYMMNGKMVTCTTTCFGNGQQCTTSCF